MTHDEARNIVARFDDAERAANLAARELRRAERALESLFTPELIQAKAVIEADNAGTPTAQRGLFEEVAA